MKSLSNECGSRNSFGYYDCRMKEIILRRPCAKKQDIEDAYRWVDTAGSLSKFSLGMGTVEVFVGENSNSGLYASARGMLKDSIAKSRYADTEMLRNFLQRLKKHRSLRNLSIKCFIFHDDAILFDLLLETIREFEHLVYLSLTGCYFSSEQLVRLAQVLSECKVVHIVWPEPKMDNDTLRDVISCFERNMALVVVQNTPPELQNIAAENRRKLINLLRKPSEIDEYTVRLIMEYRDSLMLAFAYEKEELFNLEKVFMSVIAEPKRPNGFTGNIA